MKQPLPNQFDLVPNIGALDKLLHERTSENHRHVVRRETEQLIYHLRGACWSFELLEQSRLAAVELYNQGEQAANRGLILAEDYRDKIWLSLDSYLVNMRRALDSLIPYLSRCPSPKHLPSSFSTLVKKLSGGEAYGLDETIKKLISRCWDEVGSKIKGYRDQTMHAAIVSGDCLVFRMPFGAVALEVLLPDNPFERVPSKISYDPGVPLMDFVVTSLNTVIQFVNAIVERLIDLMAPHDPNVRETSLLSFIARKPIQFGPGVEHQGEPVPFSVDARTVVKRACKQSPCATG